jgi:N-acetylmuramoyl-L-alanine amidase
LQTASLSKKPLIIIDPGHGGKDSGTVGFFGVPEKDITLAVADKVIKTLKDKGFSAMLTRDKDAFVALDERTVLANNCKQPCIFISLHGNYASNNKISGIETYCLKKDLFKQDDACVRTCIDVVDTYKESLCKEGQRLAQMVHGSILKEVRKIDARVNDRTVKHAVSQVLMGVTMPSILVEMDFLSNESQAKLLARADYQQAIADGIMQGVLQYLG